MTEKNTDYNIEYNLDLVPGSVLEQVLATLVEMEDQDILESQLRNTALAERMLRDIGVKV